VAAILISNRSRLKQSQVSGLVHSSRTCPLDSGWKAAALPTPVDPGKQLHLFLEAGQQGPRRPMEPGGAPHEMPKQPRPYAFYGGS